MQNLTSFFVDLIFAIATIILVALTSAETEVRWANGSHTKMWAELEPDFIGYE